MNYRWRTKVLYYAYRVSICFVLSLPGLLILVEYVTEMCARKSYSSLLPKRTKESLTKRPWPYFSFWYSWHLLSLLLPDLGDDWQNDQRCFHFLGRLRTLWYILRALLEVPTHGDSSSFVPEHENLGAVNKLFKVFMRRLLDNMTLYDGVKETR